jgi:hypothetical protein
VFPPVAASCDVLTGLDRHQASALGGFFSEGRNQSRSRRFLICWVVIYRSVTMCDYSLHAVATRPAQVGETLVSTKFRSTTTRGFASPDNPHVAVCLRPGTEMAFDNDVQTDGMVFRRNIGDRLARFRQIDIDRPAQHHDALEFSNGTIVLLTDLIAGQRATILQLPASPTEEKRESSEAAARHGIAARDLTGV